MKMLGGVAIWRIVTTADMAASPTQAQMQPGRSAFQTFLAALRTWRHIADHIFVAAFAEHQVLLRQQAA
jgi:hypothetical protein